MEINVAAIAPVLVVALGFIVFCLVDLRRAEQVRGLPTWGWVVVIVISVPIGGLVYLLWGRQP